MKEKAEAKKGETSGAILEWVNTQLAGPSSAKTTEAEDREKQQRDREVEDLKQQQDQIASRLSELQGGQEVTPHRNPTRHPRRC